MRVAAAEFEAFIKARIRLNRVAAEQDPSAGLRRVNQCRLLFRGDVLWLVPLHVFVGGVIERWNGKTFAHRLFSIGECLSPQCGTELAQLLSTRLGILCRCCGDQSRMRRKDAGRARSGKLGSRTILILNLWPKYWKDNEFGSTVRWRAMARYAC